MGLDKLAGKTWCWYFLVGVNYVSLECGKSPGHLDLPGWSGDNSGWVPAVTARYTLWSHWQVGCRTGLPAATPSWKCSRLEPGWTSESGAVASCLLFWDLLQTHRVIHDLSNHHFDWICLRRLGVPFTSEEVQTQFVVMWPSGFEMKHLMDFLRFVRFN